MYDFLAEQERERIKVVREKREGVTPYWHVIGPRILGLGVGFLEERKGSRESSISTSSSSSPSSHLGESIRSEEGIGSAIRSKSLQGSSHPRDFDGSLIGQ